jgi:WD40 repeat protein
MRTWQPHTSRLSSLVFSPDGKLLATTAGQSRLVWLWDATTGALVRKLSGCEYPARAVAFSPDGKHLAAMQAGPDIRVWAVETGELVSLLAIESGGFKSLAFSPVGELVAARWGSAFAWAEPLAGPPDSARKHDDTVRTGGAAERVGFSPTGRFVWSRLGTATVSAARDRPELKFDNPVGFASVNDLAFTRDETKLAVAYQSTIAAVFDLTNPTTGLVLLRGHKGEAGARDRIRPGRAHGRHGGERRHEPVLGRRDRRATSRVRLGPGRSRGGLLRPGRPHLRRGQREGKSRCVGSGSVRNFGCERTS